MSKLLSNITTIVLTWNSEGFIKKCLNSLQKSSLRTNILVVDNNSSDNTCSLVKKHFPDVKILNTGANLGYAGGNNVGITHALKDGADYVFIINPDAYVDPKCIEMLFQKLQDDPELGGVSPKIYFEGTNDLWFAGSSINWRTGETRQLGGVDIGQYDKNHSTERLNGCAMMIPVSVLKKIGLLDDKYFLYYEETDWSVSCGKQGLKLGIVPAAKTWHKNSSSTGGRLSPLYQYYMTRNRLYFMKKYKPWMLPVTVLFSLYSSMQSVSGAKHQVGPKQAKLIKKAIIKAYADFARGRLGRQKIPI